MNHYQRRLPHWDVVGQPVFVTFRLHGSGKAFVAMDRILDAASSGPVFLARAEIARLVRNALKGGQVRFQRYQLHAFVVMPSHVHLLVTPHVNAKRGGISPHRRLYREQPGEGRLGANT